MARVYPVSANKCVGELADGTPDLQLYCYEGDDDQGDPVYTCTTMRKFKATCPKVSQNCSNSSEAYVAAITCCNQRLF